MPRKIPIDHPHAPPGQRGTLDSTREHYVEVECPNDARIAEIERRLSSLESRPEPEQLPVPFDVGQIERDLIEAVSRETSASDQMQFVIKRLNTIEARQTEMFARLDNLENRPHISEETIRQLDDGLNVKIQHMIEKHVNGAMGEVRSRLIKIERSAPTSDSEAPSGQVAKLAQAIKSFGEYVERVENDLEGRVSAVEQMCAEVSEHITETNLSTMKLSTRLYRALKALDHDEADAA